MECNNLTLKVVTGKGPKEGPPDSAENSSVPVTQFENNSLATINLGNSWETLFTFKTE